MLQAIAKKLETEASIFQVICYTLIVSKHLPPSSLINAVMDLVMTFKVTSNNIERGREGVVRNVFKFSICFQECIFRWKSIFLAEYINNFATSQLPVEIQ